MGRVLILLKENIPREIARKVKPIPDILVPKRWTTLLKNLDAILIQGMLNHCLHTVVKLMIDPRCHAQNMF